MSHRNGADQKMGLAAGGAAIGVLRRVANGDRASQRTAGVA
jgi:hypothetical protein